MTDRRRLGEGADAVTLRECLLGQVAHAAAARIDVVQVREHDLETAALVSIVGQAVAMTRGTNTRVIVNDRLDVALACGADGVHLGWRSVSVEAVRGMAPAGFLVGRSVHSTEEALIHGAGADYLIAGTVWPTASKPPRHGYLGLDGLADIARTARVPVLAIGGVTIERMAEIAAAGAGGAAAIGLFMRDGDGAPAAGCRAMPLLERARAARAAFDTSRSGS